MDAERSRGQPPCPEEFTMAIAEIVIFYSCEDEKEVEDFVARIKIYMANAGHPVTSVTLYQYDHLALKHSVPKRRENMRHLSPALVLCYKCFL